MTTASRGIGTLIGNGWLHEAPRNVWPRGWDVKSRSALRKCMFLPAADGRRFGQAAAMAPPVVAPLPRVPIVETPTAPKRRDPRRDVRAMHAIQPGYAALSPGDRARLEAYGRPAAAPIQAWYEDPVALGTLLIFAPPIGLAALWSSKRYSPDARWALTVMTGLTMCLCTAIGVALMVR